jgi:ADP-heptose:LPS heptosyltransferase
MSFSPLSLFLGGVISSTKVFFKNYILKKFFKEGFEGITFSVCDAHAELLGYLRYYELYIRGGKLLYDNLSSLENILIIKLRDIGDNILCTPLIRNLKYHLPNTSISVLTWSYSIPVFEKNPHIDHLFKLPKNPSSKDISKLQNELNSIDFDLVMSTHSGGLPSKLLSKIKSSNKINNLYRGRNKLYTILTKESDYYRSSIERDLDCFRSLGLEPKNTHTEIFLTSHETTWARKAMEARGIDFTKKIILIHPTAAVSIREWPLEKFNQLIKSLNNQTNIQIVAICTEIEYSKVKALLDDIPSLVVFHKITVRQMMAIIHECDLVIDNDSSPSHIATAFGIPTIVLFSQAIKKIFRPYHQEKDQHFIFYNDVNCRECELTQCDDRICLNFSSDEVYTQALQMLSLEKN